MQQGDLMKILSGLTGLPALLLAVAMGAGCDQPQGQSAATPAAPVAAVATDPASSTRPSPDEDPATATSPSLAPAPAGSDAASTAPAIVSPTIVVSGQLAIADLDSETLGTDGVSVANRDVEVKDSSGNALARTISAADGTYSAILPGSVALQTEAGLALLSSGATVEAVIADTANGSVIGTRQPLNFAQSSHGALALGKTTLAKITAIRGRAMLDGARDHTGISIYAPGTSFQARTDAAGNFLMTFIPEGTYDLRIERDGFLPVDLPAVVVGANETTKLAPLALKLSGGTSDFTVRQLGSPGLSRSRSVEFQIDGGNADRFKAGRQADVESTAFTSVPSSFTYTFDEDGSYLLKFVFANADGFETTVERSVVVDTVAPSAAQLRLADRSSLDVAQTNERHVIAFHPTCDDISQVAILPASITSVRDSDFNFSCSTTSTKQIHFSLPEGASSFDYLIWVKDQVGNLSSAPTPHSITFDNTPPDAPDVSLSDQTIQASPAKFAGTDITTVDVNVASCADTAYILLSETQFLQPDPAQFTLECAVGAAIQTFTFANNIAGTKTVLAWAMDLAGNVSAQAKVLTIALDDSAPSASSFTLADPTPTHASYSNSNILTASVASCTDTTHVLISEAQASKPSENAAGWRECASGGLDVSVAFDGFKQFNLWARDVAGNVSATGTTASITVDTVAPSAPSFSIADQSSSSTSFTNSTIVNLSISCSDSNQIVVRESQTPSPAASDFVTSCTGSLTHAFTTSTEGNKTLYLWGRDQAGNISTSPSSATITLDTTPPGIPVSLTLADQSSNSTTYTNSGTVGFAIDTCPVGALLLVQADQSSPPSEYAAWQSCALSGAVAISTGSQGSKTVYVWTKDSAGNVSASSRSQSIVYDSIAPTTPTLALSDQAGGSSANYTNDLVVNVSLSSCTGIDAILLTASATTPTEDAVSIACSSTANAYTWTFSGSDGSKRLYVFSRDAAGNIGAGSYADITYDTGVPSISNLKVTAVGTDRFTATWSSSESLYTRLRYDPTSSPVTYAQSYLTASSTASHTAAVTGLSPDTTYYWKADASDFAEHTTLSAESSVKTFALTKLFGPENQGLFGGYISGDNVSRTLTTCDLNFDGIDDIVIGAPKVDANGVDSGAVYVIFGSSSLATSLDFSTDTPDIRYHGSTSSRYIGGVGCLDFNGDGKKDLLIVEANWQSTTNWYVIQGSTTITTGNLSVTAAKSHSGTFTYSHNFATGGDLDGDGKEDFILCGSSLTGCSVFYGTTSASVSAQHSFLWNSSGSLGKGLAIADIDGDGLSDIMLGYSALAGETNSGSNNGVIFVKRGNATRPTGTINMHSWTPSIHPVDYEIHGAASSMAISNVFAGNIDGDAYADLLIGTGSDLLIFFGRPASGSGGVDWADDPYVQVAAADLRFTGVTTSLTSSIVVRDVNGDAYADILIGDKGESSSRGQACLFLGRSQADWAALATSNAISMTKADLCVNGADTSDELGAMVAIGNLDGSGTKELIFTAGFGDGSSDAGNNVGEAGVLFWNLPSLYSNIQVDMSPHY